MALYSKTAPLSSRDGQTKHPASLPAHSGRPVQDTLITAEESVAQPIEAHAAIALEKSPAPERAVTRRPAPGALGVLGVLTEGAPRVSVVIPARNEARNLPHVLPRIPEWVYEVILVDGHSTDDTVEVARALWPDIRVVQEVGRGKGAALRTGFAAANGDILVMLDADGSTDPGEIPAFVGALLAGADFVKGSRFVQGAGTADMSFIRRAGNWGFVWMVRLMFGGNFSDLCYGYNAFWRHVLPELRLDCDGFEVETLMNLRALQAGYKVAEVPSFEAERVHGESNLRALPDGWRVTKTILKEWLAPRRRSESCKPGTAAVPPARAGRSEVWIEDQERQL